MKLSRFFLVSIVAALLASCHSNQGSMEYFKDIETFQPVEVGDYLVKIEPSDELVITVTSLNPAASAMYNLPYINPTSPQNTMRQGTPDQQTYTVDSKGYITFPVLGKIYVEGMTCEQLESLLTQRISQEVEDPVVSVQLASFTVIVTGEVMRPSRVSVYKPRFTVLDALSQAGDLTQYGRRDNVLLIREEDGKRIHTRLDLNSADLLSSPYYYLKQNDYIYVEPNKVRQDNAEYNTFNSFRLQVVSTIVSASASIISLIIALSR